MNDKHDRSDRRPQHILGTALHLFATKGFHATSIQDIAEAVGIAKGTVYLHFKSKEDLLISALKQTLQRMVEAVADVVDVPDLPPRERLVRKLAKQFQFGIEHKAFFTMVMNEGMAHVNDDLKSFMDGLRIHSARWSLDDVMAVYGERIGDYAPDAVVIMQAIVSHYTAIMILNEAEPDMDRLARFLVDRLDDAVEGMLRSGQPPIMTKSRLLVSYSAEAGISDQPDGNVQLETVLLQLRRMKAAIAESGLDETKRSELSNYVSVLEHELRKPEPGSAVLEGLLAHLRECGPPALAPLADRLGQLLPSYRQNSQLS